MKTHKHSFLSKLHPDSQGNISGAVTSAAITHGAQTNCFDFALSIFNYHTKKTKKFQAYGIAPMFATTLSERLVFFFAPDVTDIDITAELHQIDLAWKELLMPKKKVIFYSKKTDKNSLKIKKYS